MKKIRVFIKPGSKSQKVQVQKDLQGEDTYVVSVRSLPKEGAANIELVEILSEHFGVSKSSVEIKSGFKSRNKIVLIHKV